MYTVSMMMLTKQCIFVMTYSKRRMLNKDLILLQLEMQIQQELEEKERQHPLML